MGVAKKLNCFKAYDIRGKLGEEINEEVAYRIARAYALNLNAKRVVVGCDVRLSSPSLKQAIINGLLDSGVDVIDIGITGTEEVYFASFHLDVDGGIELTASHNPMDYNGMKLVGRGALPISNDSGLQEIKKIAELNSFPPVSKKGCLSNQSILMPYISHLISYLSLNKLKPLVIVVNAGNGCAGHVIDALEQEFFKLNVPIRFIKVHHEANGEFPNGIPNPLLPENRASTSQAVKEHHADLGVAWDGDFDRCFLFDEKGEFVEGYYIVGLLAEAFLKKHPGEKIIHDPRLTWNTIDIVNANGGIAIQSKTGHAFIKERMRAENAIYGGEMSAHHYFRDFSYCDSGMIPWLLVAELMCSRNRPLSNLLSERISLFPCSGEINFKVKDAQSTIQKVLDFYANKKPAVDRTDGISLEFGDWRMNLRTSNTESLLRLNVETKANNKTICYHVTEIEEIIKT